MLKYFIFFCFFVYLSTPNQAQNNFTIGLSINYLVNKNSKPEVQRQVLTGTQIDAQSEVKDSYGVTLWGNYPARKRLSFLFGINYFEFQAKRVFNFQNVNDRNNMTVSTTITSITYLNFGLPLALQLRANKEEKDHSFFVAAGIEPIISVSQRKTRTSFRGNGNFFQGDPFSSDPEAFSFMGIIHVGYEKYLSENFTVFAGAFYKKSLTRQGETYFFEDETGYYSYGGVLGVMYKL